MTEQITSNGLIWYCTTCGESVTHQHRPLKPDYQELLATLKEVQGALRDGSHPRELVNEMLDRAERGR